MRSALSLRNALRASSLGCLNMELKKH